MEWTKRSKEVTRKIKENNKIKLKKKTTTKRTMNIKEKKRQRIR